MKQILQSYKTGELWLAEVPMPACKSGGVVVRTVNSFVSAGTERMLVDFAGKSGWFSIYACNYVCETLLFSYINNVHPETNSGNK